LGSTRDRHALTPALSQHKVRRATLAASHNIEKIMGA
jgi:hypothetical protein